MEEHLCICTLCYHKLPKDEFQEGTSVCVSCYDAQNKFFKFLRRHKIYKPEYCEINQITEKIWLGNDETQFFKEKLQSLGITHILVVGRELEIYHPNHFIYKKIDAIDSPFNIISKYFDDTYEFIEESDKIYVHCAAGVSRSATIVIAYLMKKENLDFEKSFKRVQNKRPIISPNLGFQRQLKEYEKKLEQENLNL